MSENYIPYGSAWRAEAKKFKKDQLIDMLANALQENRKLNGRITTPHPEWKVDVDLKPEDLLSIFSDFEDYLRYIIKYAFTELKKNVSDDDIALIAANNSCIRFKAEGIPFYVRIR